MHIGLHHAIKHKREGNATLLDHVMIVIGIIGPLSVVPQVITVWIDGDITGISLLTWVLLTVSSSMWMIYGISHRSAAIITANTLFTVFNFMVIVGVLMHH